MTRAHAGVLLISVSMSFSCRSGDAPGSGARARAGSAQSAANHAPRAKPVFVRGPTHGEPVAPFVAKQVADGSKGRYGVLVYVGATWCEPCRRFHAAAEAGELDAILGGAHLVEFDLDADKQALLEAGYSSQLIPLFCVPKTDGTASDRRMEGSIKGPEALDQNLVPRLRALLGNLG